MFRKITAVVLSALLLACTLLPTFTVFASGGGTLYVSPDGNDSASGTVNAPLASLAGAKESAKQLGNIGEVVFRGGTYTVDETVNFDASDASDVIYKAYDGEKEIAETGEQKIEEAETSEQALSSIEAVDDDTAAAVEEARSESDAIAKGVAESEIEEPGEQVSGSFKETSEESTEYSEQELENADTATEMTGDYGDVGSELSSQFQESGQEFQEIADEADQENDEMKSKLDQEVAELEGVF